MRYVVTEIEGDDTPRPGGKQSARAGLSCHVIDSGWNRRIVASYRTEDVGRNQHPDSPKADPWVFVREQAATRCALLNRLDEIAQDAAQSREAVPPLGETAA